jgi:hypothetical protein
MLEAENNNAETNVNGNGAHHSNSDEDDYDNELSSSLSYDGADDHIHASPASSSDSIDNPIRTAYNQLVDIIAAQPAPTNGFSVGDPFLAGLLNIGWRLNLWCPTSGYSMIWPDGGASERGPGSVLLDAMGVWWRPFNATSSGIVGTTIVEEDDEDEDQAEGGGYGGDDDGDDGGPSGGAAAIANVKGGPNYETKADADDEPNDEPNGEPNGMADLLPNGVMHSDADGDSNDEEISDGSLEWRR